MKTVTWTENISLDDVLRPGEADEVLLMRDGHAVALLIPFDDDDLAWYTSEPAPAFLASIAEARRQVERGDSLGHDELKRELGID
jgi:hypothetical protein